MLETTIHGTMTISSNKIKDYLSILGLADDFDDSQLKKAFRREARKWHPDLNNNDINAEDRFKLINEAYEFLRNSTKKNLKDRNIDDDSEKNNFKRGFPEFQDYLDTLFGFEYNKKTENDQFNDFYDER